MFAFNIWDLLIGCHSYILNHHYLIQTAEKNIKIGQFFEKKKK